MNKLAHRFSPLLAVTVVSLAAACGGNVVVDHGSSQGNGGAGASGGNHSTSTLSAMGGSTSDVSPVGPGPGPGPGPGVGGNSTTTSMQVGPGPGPGPGPGVSASTGPQQCDCNTFCDDVNQCFMVGNQCQMFCGQIPQNILQCTCDAAPDCNKIMNCFQMGTGPGPGSNVSVGPGPGPGAGGSSGTGGGTPMACSDCANNAFMGACGMQAQECEQHQGCVDLVNCESSCNFEPMCVDGCKMQASNNNNNRAQALLECAVCEQCPMECANTDLFTTACTLPP
jgi:hypothetical protein